jgi:NADPH:quinone reductase-like Zn-dependent oxidoreductase
MKYIDFVAGEKADSLFLSECDEPIAVGSEVVVEVKSFGVNRADILQRKGLYPPPKGESLILGLEVAGVVVAIGPDVDKWKMGDRVFGLVAGGGYAELVAVEQSHLMPMPSNLSFSEAGAIAEVFLTAYQALFTLGNLSSKQKVLIHAGALFSWRCNNSVWLLVRRRVMESLLFVQSMARMYVSIIIVRVL